MIATLRDRVEAKIERSATCWLWTAAVDAKGYGKIYVATTSRWELAHRVVYQLYVGPIPEGLTLDHLCRVRHCVNPAHLEPVTQGENTLRGDSPAAKAARRSHCVNGHPYDEANTYVFNWARQCRACNREVQRRKRERAAA